MTNSAKMHIKSTILVVAIVIMTVGSARMHADTGTCGGSSITIPFTDVTSSNNFFCAIAEAFFSALTNGTSATTYSPSDPVPREQMSAFITRTLDLSIKRGSQRAALDQLWTTQAASASDGKLLETWTGATDASGVVVAMGKVFITGFTTPGALYLIDPTQAPGAVTLLCSCLPAFPLSIAFDGQRIWTAGDSVSIISFNPFSVNTVTAGFSNVKGVLYDGTNIWVTDAGDDTIKKLDANGSILQSVSVGHHPYLFAFDGTNIWVPNGLNATVSVVRASSGMVLATLSGNGVSGPNQVAFDGERILVTNFNGNSVSLWKATDLTPIGTFSVGANTAPYGVCSDGLSFWITLSNTNKLARF